MAKDRRSSVVQQGETGANDWAVYRKKACTILTYALTFLVLAVIAYYFVTSDMIVDFCHLFNILVTTNNTEDY